MFLLSVTLLLGACGAEEAENGDSGQKIMTATSATYEVDENEEWTEADQVAFAGLAGFTQGLI